MVEISGPVTEYRVACQCSAALPRQYQARPRCLSHPLALSEPVAFKQFLCCNCRGVGDVRIGTTFFATCRVVEHHISRSRACKAAGKGVGTATMVYRESRRLAEDQEAGAVGAPGQWPVRPAGSGGAAGIISTPISCFWPDIVKRRYRYIEILIRHWE